MGNALALFVTLAWLPVVLYLFIRFPAQRALVISFIAAWMFLPLVDIVLPGIPDLTKMNTACYSILLATVINDFERIKSFRFGWMDVPMAAYCIVPFITSLTNDLGAYDGLATALEQTMAWGVPYFLGRIYLNSFFGLRQMAIGIFIGGLVYIPLCLFEVVRAISLHEIFYGFRTVTLEMSVRYGGYRPAVFMETGLMLGVWMMSATLMGIVLWRTGIVKKVWTIPVNWLVGILLITFILVKATGAYTLLLLALVILFTAEWFSTALVLWMVLAGMFIFLYLSVTGALPGQQIVDFLTQLFDADRVQSLGFRLMNEEFLSEKARQRFLFGWGGYGRNQIYNAQGQMVSVTDSLWIIAFGSNGLVGLISIFTALILPAVSFCIFYPPRFWTHPSIAPAAALAVGLLMYSLDCILNAMVNPVFALTCGGIAGTLLTQPSKVTLNSRRSPQLRTLVRH